MAELFGHDLEGHPGSQRQARGRVSEVVQPDGREAGAAVQLFEDGRRGVGVQLRPVLPREDQAGVLPRRAPRPSLVGLVLAPVAQDGHRAPVQRDGPRPAVGLGITDLGRPAELDDLLRDPQDAGVEVDVLPAEPHCLTSAQAPVGHQVEHRVEPVLGSGVEERAGLLGGPHGDRWA